MITLSASAPDPKNLKKKALLVMKAREELNDDYGENGFFPSGIENEVVFQEITGKCLSNLHAQCQVSPPLPIFLSQLLALGKDSLRYQLDLLSKSSDIRIFEFYNRSLSLMLLVINCHLFDQI